jgi:peptidoglycan/LPS O-acetylase OafA/YrhL
MQDAAHLKSLTSLRFFAAFWVVLFHYWPHLDAGFQPAFVDRGYLGVEAFFTLSGFILSHVYLSQVEEGRFRYGSFLWNRLARVYPLHLATLIGIGAMALGATFAGLSVDPNILSWSSLPANLLMVHAWGFATTAGWNHPSWSISAEWFAYLTFPLFAWLAGRLRHRPHEAALGALVLLFGLYLLFERIAGFPLTRATIHWGALRIVPCFAFGCALFLVWRNSATDRRKAAVAASIYGAGVAIGATFLAPDALLVAGLGGLILSLAQLAKSGSGFATHPIFVYLGEISYSTYMICVPWGILFANGSARLLGLDADNLPLGIWLVLLLGVIPLSAASYHLIEKPARSWMKLIADKRRGHELATV